MLPEIVVPHYELTLPISNKKITYRPFLVKEEKLMLLAAASKDPLDIQDAIKQVVSNCVIQPQNFDVMNTSVIDIEWILINLRIRSIGKSIEAEYTCKSKIDDEGDICGTPFIIKYNLEDIEVIKDPDVKNDIWLTPDIGVTIRPPVFKTINFLPGTKSYILEDSIERVFDRTSTYSFQDEPLETRTKWLDNLSKAQYDKLTEYLANQPKFVVQKTHKCEKCGTTHNVKIADITSFF